MRVGRCRGVDYPGALPVPCDAAATHTVHFRPGTFDDASETSREYCGRHTDSYSKSSDAVRVAALAFTELSDGRDRAPASIAGGGEAGAEKRSAPNGAGSAAEVLSLRENLKALQVQLTDAQDAAYVANAETAKMRAALREQEDKHWRYVTEAQQERERLRNVAAVVERERDAAKKETAALRSSGAALGGVLDLQRRRIGTLEAVGRIARAALSEAQSYVDTFVTSASLGHAQQVKEALDELNATLPDERDGFEASLADQPATSSTPLNPELMVQSHGVATYTTLREFLDEHPDDEQARAAALALKPGDSVTLAGSTRQGVYTVTRKAA